jgi:hypothetical protein
VREGVYLGRPAPDYLCGNVDANGVICGKTPRYRFTLKEGSMDGMACEACATVIRTLNNLERIWSIA